MVEFLREGESESSDAALKKTFSHQPQTQQLYMARAG